MYLLSEEWGAVVLILHSPLYQGCISCQKRGAVEGLPKEEGRGAFVFVPTLHSPLYQGCIFCQKRGSRSPYLAQSSVSGVYLLSEEGEQVTGEQ